MREGGREAKSEQEGEKVERKRGVKREMVYTSHSLIRACFHIDRMATMVMLIIGNCEID